MSHEPTIEGYVKPEWGTWECPVCGDICEDPDTVFSTSCHKGHSVMLSTIDGSGNRRAFIKSENP